MCRDTHLCRLIATGGCAAPLPVRARGTPLRAAVAPVGDLQGQDALLAELARLQLAQRLPLPAEHQPAARRRLEHPPPLLAGVPPARVVVPVVQPDLPLAVPLPPGARPVQVLPPPLPPPQRPLLRP